MTDIFVRTDAFTSMLAVLVPFTRPAKSDDRIDGKPAVCEIIDCQTSTEGELILSARNNAGAWAVGKVQLVDYEGEVTDFAIHRDDAAVITKQFKAGPDDLETLRLRIEHAESTRREKKQDGEYLEYVRSTLITINEESKIVGARSSRFPGADARHLYTASFWRQAASHSLNQDDHVYEFPLKPATIKALATATKCLGEPTVIPLHKRLIARIGQTFLAGFSNHYEDPTTDLPRAIEHWQQQLITDADTIPEHTLFEQLTGFEEVTINGNIHIL